MTTTSRARAARFITCLAAGLGALVPTPGVGQATVTLEDAIRTALARSPQMLQREQAIDNAAQSHRQAVGAFIPSLSANSGGSLRSTNNLDPTTGRIVSGSSDSYSAGLSARVDLFQGGRRFAELDRARADMRAAEADRTDQRFQVTLQTKNLFFAALRQQDLLEVSRQRVAQVERNLEIVRTRARLSQATLSDSLRARLDFVNAQQAVIQGETALRAARFALGRQIGVAEPVVPVRPDGLEPSPLPLNDAEVMTIAESTSPAVLAAAEASAAAGAAVTSARTVYLPSVSLSSGYNWANQAASLSNGTTSWSVSISASYPIFNQFQREASVDRAEFSRRVAGLQEDDARLAARQEADAALYTLRTAQRAIAIAEDAVRVAAEDLRVVRERYDVGVATILDLLVSQSAADQANADLVTARYDYLLARAELEAILGRELS